MLYTEYTLLSIKPDIDNKLTTRVYECTEIYTSLFCPVPSYIELITKLVLYPENFNTLSLRRMIEIISVINKKISCMRNIIKLSTIVISDVEILWHRFRTAQGHQGSNVVPFLISSDLHAENKLFPISMVIISWDRSLFGLAKIIVHLNIGQK